MNDDDSFDMSELRSKQIEALKYQLRQNLLAAKIQYQDAIRRIDYTKVKYVTRDCNMIVDIRHGVIPICFMEN